MTNAFPLPAHEKLSPPPWAGNPALAALITALNGDSPRPQALLVGGCVRNAVLSRPITDIDIATPLPPDEVMARAQMAGIRVIPTGIDHGTVTCVVDHQGFEVTTLRQDLQTDGRHAKVGFTTDWTIDAARRDFTLNTLLADLDGHVYEPIPGALNDARAGQVRFVGDAPTRIAEDYLRILRFFRFHAHYGVGEMDPDGLAACAAAAPHLSTLSRERITQEIIKWLGADDPGPSLNAAIAAGIFHPLFPRAVSARALAPLVAAQNGADLVDTTARLFALFGAAPVAEMIAPLALSGKQIKFLHALEKNRVSAGASAADLRRAIYRYGHDIALQSYLVAVAAAGATPIDLTDLRSWVVPPLPVTGADLIAAGLSPGPELGAHLISIKTKWLESDFNLIKEDLLRI